MYSYGPIVLSLIPNHNMHVRAITLTLTLSHNPVVPGLFGPRACIHVKKSSGVETIQAVLQSIKKWRNYGGWTKSVFIL